MALKREHDYSKVAEARAHKKKTGLLKSDVDEDDPALDLIPVWEDRRQAIHMRTGISDPLDFFAKYTNSHSLESQMELMKNAAELRLKELKVTAAEVEQE